MTRCLTLLLMGLLMTCSVVSAQILGTGVMPVVEVGANLYQNTITAVQAVLSVKNELLELLPLDEILVAGDIVNDMRELGEIAHEAEQLAFDLQSLNAQIHELFDLDTAPATRPALDARLVAMKRTIYTTRVFAVRTQTLLTTVFCTVDHLTRLINSVRAFAGQKQATQTLVQMNTTISKTLAVQEVQNAAFQRAETIDKLSEAMVIESVNRIEASRMQGWPRW